MNEQDLLETAKVVAGLMPRLARGLSSPEKDPADDLPLAQLRLCGILSEGPRPMSALSRTLGVSLSALTQIADRLERARLVKRVAEENDRRVRCLQLTARGEKMTSKRREARVRRTVEVLEHLSVQEREAVRASLEILVDACSAVQSGKPDSQRESQRGKNPGEHVITVNGNANHHPKTSANETSSNKGSKSKVIP
jgi:DNA-binding MarR family transcriptional regulator